MDYKMKTIKPLFLRNAKHFDLGSRVGLHPQREDLASPMPTC